MTASDEVPAFASVEDAWREHNLSQLRYFRALSLREKLLAVEGMADVVRRLDEAHVQRAPKVDRAPNSAR